MDGQSALVGLCAVAGGDGPLLERYTVQIDLGEAQGTGENHMPYHARTRSAIAWGNCLVAKNELV
ncbi:hypothetical protein D3C72_2560790 [compost metagenome]